jgi:PKD repeat protein
VQATTGGATVEGTHTYRTVPAGDPATAAYTVTVTVTDPQTDAAVSATAAAQVADQPWGLDGGTAFSLEVPVTYPATGPDGTAIDQPFTGQLGYLADYNPLWLPSDYQVSVDYGDGSAPTPAVLTPVPDPQGGSDPVGEIAADHVYTVPGTYVVTVTAHDEGTGQTETLYDVVTANVRPFPVNQFAATGQDTLAVIPLQALDPDGDPLTYTIFRGPSHGNVSLFGDQVVYTPNPGFAGDDAFLFQASDGTLSSNLGLVRVHVAAVSPPLPVTSAPIAEDEPPTVALVDSLWVVHAGEQVGLAATASDVLGPADITDVEWDFNYDGSSFVADPAGSGTLTPAYAYATPGIYVVAVQVTNAAGESALDVDSVEVLDPTDPVADSVTPNPPAPPSTDPPTDPPPPSGPANPAFAPQIQFGTASVNVGDSVAFTATAGAGIDTADQSASWDFNYNGTNFDTQASGSGVSHTFIAPGVYTVAAYVSDGSGDNQLVTTTVAVADVPALVVVPPADQVVEEGQAVAFTAPQAVDLVGTADPTSVQWDFTYDGSTFVADPTAAGQLTPSHLYAPGNYVAAVQLSDDQGHTALGLVNVQVDALPPDVSAGTDLTVRAGQPVTFQGAASAVSGITSVNWDFNYDGENFVADPSAQGTLTPTYTFVEPGTYTVALDAVDGDGLDNLDVITVTVTDVAPTGAVALSPTDPDGTAQATPTAGSPVTFAVTGMADVDPSVTPSLWADWNGDGNFSLVTPDQWQNVSASAGGESLLFSYTYDAPGTYHAVFRIEDAEGNFAESDLTVTAADAPPSGTFGWGDPVHTIASTDTISFTNVTDPSQTESDAGFTYYYQLDGGGYQASDSPDFTVEGLPPGTTHTIQAYIQDAAGTDSPVYTQQVQVQGDVDFANTGTGAVRLDWTGQDGATGSTTIAAGQTYTFADEPAGVNVTLLTPGASYDLSTNGSIDAIDGSGVSGVTLEVHTDDSEGMPDPVGDGHVGPITLGANSTVTVGSRGDFGGLTGTGTGVVAPSLVFDNLTGPIGGVQHINLLQANGDVSGVSVTDGIDYLEGYSLTNISTETDPSGPVTAAGVVVGPGGPGVGLTFGNQPATLVQLDASDNITSITDPQGNVATIGYGPDGAPATLTDAQGTFTFDYGTGPAAAAGIGGGPAATAAGPGFRPQVGEGFRNWVAGKAADLIYGGVVMYDSAKAAAAVGSTVVQVQLTTLTIGAQVISAKATQIWQVGVNDQVRWILDTADRQWMEVAGQVVSASKQLAEAFVQNLEKFAEPFAVLWSQLQQFGTAAQQVLQAIVANPTGFLSNLGAGVWTGIQSFINGLGGQLKNYLFQWLAPGLQGVDPPTDWSAAGIGQWLLQVFRLDWPHIQQMLVKLADGNVALVTDAYNYLAKFISEPGLSGVFNWLNSVTANLTPAQLVQRALTPAVNYLVQNLVPKALTIIAAKFAVPGLGILTGIYNTVSWLFSSLGQFQQLAGLATQIVQKIGDVVAGQTAALALSVTQFLNGLVPVALNFVAAQVPELSNLPKQVGAIINEVTSYPSGLVQQGIDYILNSAKAVLGLKDHPEYQGLVGPPLSFQVAGQSQRLWVANQNGRAVIMRTSPAAPLDLKKDLPPGLSASQFGQVQADYNQVVQLANQIIQAVKASGQNGLAQAAQQTAPLQQAQARLQGDLIQAGAVCFANACFAAGTPLLTPDGDRPIERFRVGDAILSRPEGNPAAAVEVQLVEEVFVRTGRIMELRAGGQCIRTTAEHPFWSRRRGWTPAGELESGDELVGHDGRWTRVEGLRDTGTYETVYNLRISGHHTYFVGAREWGFSVWAHNVYVGLDPVNYNYSLADNRALRLGRILRNRAVLYRVTNAVSSGRNVAVILFRRNGQLFTRAFQSMGVGAGSDSETHAEQVGIRQLLDEGIQSSDILALYTDRFPCEGCNIFLRDFGLPRSARYWGIKSGTSNANQIDIINRAVQTVTQSMAANNGSFRFPLFDSELGINT